MKPEIKKLLILNAPYLLFVYLFDKVGQAVRLAPGADMSAKLLSIGDGFSAAFSNAFPSVHPADLLIGLAGAVIVRLAVYIKGKNAKKYRKGIEYGSARWGKAEDIKPYIDPVFQNNVLLTQTERLTMNSRPKQPKYARNKNILVIGGSGSGKTRFFVKPNLMQMHSSYVVTDPKGTVLIECGKLLQRGGYKIKVLNTINFKKSMRYNPFVYIRSEKDILKLVNTIIANTKGDGEKSGEDFWVKSERLFYCALIGYIYYEAPEAEKNFTTLLEMINASEAREDDPEFQSPVDLMFERLEEKTRNILLSGNIRNSCFRRAKHVPQSSFPAGRGLPPLTYGSCGNSWKPMKWSLIRWATAKRRCSLSFPTPTIPLILSYQSFTRSFSISFATRQMMCTAGGCPSMCAVC